jgi:hypothetical protein
LGDCSGSESDDEEENPSQGFYINPLVSDDPWTTHAGASEDTLSTEDDDDVAYVEHNLADGEVESHHCLYWKCDGVLEEPQRKMPKMSGRLKPGFEKNFGTPLDSIMSIFPLIYWKIIYRETNDNAHVKLEQQFATTGKRTISGSRWTRHTTFQEILQFYGIPMMMVMFHLPGAAYLHIGAMTRQCFYGQTLSPYADSNNSAVLCTSIRIRQKSKANTLFTKCVLC